ncbi:type II toxin-antitoxin system Rv0910 family toxin [Amycolatopsis cihanbeyliensis]|uniref:Polyketide cyclase/dehydrase/lipid transport protein n=1 Tax=Amycolatopsis cihanbeyliensis TaxID=1128664 RepID=A0A542CU59_AMYCI|nr:SRPBCC family protein [Amycolatopsis cihanbeyliensis]TQI94358.1 polyketide cyclase/dehydrase/lipid transport protein [Amycolatopsis cihanbeyliensis]
MGQINASVDLPGTPEQVWEVFSDPNNFEKWLTIHTKWKGEVPSEFKEGSKVTEVVTMMGMPNTIEWTVDAYEAPSTLSISGTGMAGVKVRFDLSVQEAPGGSQATIDAEFTGQMIVGALGKAVEKDGKKNLDRSMEKLKELLG